MAVKRLFRGGRAADDDRLLSDYGKRNDRFGRRQVLLVVAATLVVLTGSLVGWKTGGRGRSNADAHAVPATIHLVPGTMSSDALLANTATSSASSQQTEATSTMADKSQQDSKQQQQAVTDQTQQQAYAGLSHDSDAAAHAASKEAGSGEWASGLKNQLSAASSKMASGIHSLSGKGQNAVAAMSAQEEDAAASRADSIAAVRAQAGRPQFVWDVPMTERILCNDTCHKARDGKCDDGSRGEDDQVFCDLGTDCSDCGDWTALLPQTQPNQTQPLKLLHDKQIDVFVKNTSTVPVFSMAYTDPKKDVDVSGQMEFGGVVEIGLTMMWYKVLRDKCIKPDGSRRLVLDVGGNFGWYSIYAAKHGCRVITWEPVPQFRAFLEYNRQLNRLEDLIEIRSTAVSDAGGVTRDLKVPSKGIWGTAGFDGLNIDRGVYNAEEYEGLEVIQAVGERLDEVVHEDVLLLKIDVEGFEPGVIDSAEDLLADYQVDNIVMEYTPGAWEYNSKWRELADLPAMLSLLLEQQYTILHVDDSLSRSPLLSLPNWTGPISPIEEVTAENIQHDVSDAKQIFERTLGCPKPEELEEQFPDWEGCNHLPQDLHPKSFRACFGHNTNVWLMQDRNTFQVGKPVGVLAPDQDLNQWYGSRPLELGMGYRPCEHLEPDQQVRHRCQCTDKAVCGKEAKLVQTLAKQGKMFPHAKR